MLLHSQGLFEFYDYLNESIWMLHDPCQVTSSIMLELEFSSLQEACVLTFACWMTTIGRVKFVFWINYL